MKHSKITPRSLITKSAVVAFSASTILFSLPATANDLNVHPASCVAPVLNQAFPMRWHENFLMNPADGVPTWVICPLNFDNDISPITVGTPFAVGVIGSHMPGAEDSLPDCFFTIHRANNTLLKGYADGVNLTLTEPLRTEVIEDATLWFAAGGGQILSPPGVENFEQASVICRLSTGYAISAITLSDDFEI